MPLGFRDAVNQECGIAIYYVPTGKVLKIWAFGKFGASNEPTTYKIRLTSNDVPLVELDLDHHFIDYTTPIEVAEGSCLLMEGNCPAETRQAAGYVVFTIEPA